MAASQRLTIKTLFFFHQIININTWNENTIFQIWPNIDGFENNVNNLVGVKQSTVFRIPLPSALQTVDNQLQ